MSGPLHVAVTPGVSVEIPEAELGWRFSRSSGPGGQHVNTSATAAELIFDVAGSAALPPPLRDRALRRLAGRLVDGTVTIRAEEYRSQLRNREAARERLADLLRTALAPPPKRRKATRPSRGAVERRLENKKRRSTLKEGRRRDW
ncbi:alternative ribosome rescue aminoacyl-tRNA hydrolase ArfB [Actinocorallia sp. A-T 12471]|uniref:alternative ribosome rescue aminoacyl-tRNA hydrolase ArfB n=1 Tax=Actinocorallia sp. A-T 12471 TaxID=3089813 RepID=UPI0029CECDF0|nr:alternative ribosome rescue aminoacyl-tRNA hydrolase ArfB [Actinocorallia sp. A-T 12471]MDX6738171.1 alternative ribosome rescue aminoacyl-tRNA hydrolase ArfB [Actinocorallia sp. A-T 12471]